MISCLEDHMVTLAIILIVLTICVIIDNHYKKIVREHSQRVKELLDLNKTILFKEVRPRYSEIHVCNSKRQLENFSLDDYLITSIDSNESFYRNIVDAISFNRREYTNYIEQSKTIRSTATEDFCKQYRIKLSKFQKYEERVFKRSLLKKPQYDVDIYCKATYTSPKGKNHYWKDHHYYFIELERLFHHTIELKEQRKTRQYQIKVERSKMTDSLRYDIFKRDNFRCQICGSAQQDGVKLHVDHIVPVSKGGLTIKSNLRTLCDRCNMGKSNKM